MINYSKSDSNVYNEMFILLLKITSGTAEYEFNVNTPFQQFCHD